MSESWARGFPRRNLGRDALRVIGARPTDCALITASATSAEDALCAGVGSIGYATSAGDLGADCILPSLADLVLRLRARPMPLHDRLELGGG